MKIGPSNVNQKLCNEIGRNVFLNSCAVSCIHSFLNSSVVSPNSSYRALFCDVLVSSGLYFLRKVASVVRGRWRSLLLSIFCSDELGATSLYFLRKVALVLMPHRNCYLPSSRNRCPYSWSRLPYARTRLPYSWTRLALFPNSFALFPNSFALFPNSFVLIPELRWKPF